MLHPRQVHGCYGNPVRLRCFSLKLRELIYSKCKTDLSIEQKAHERLKAVKSVDEQAKYNFDIYTTKYGYCDVVNKTVREIQREEEAKRNAQERRYSPEEHGVITDWNERQHFRVFYGKDHAATQTDQPTKADRMASRGCSTEDPKWERASQTQQKLHLEAMRSYYKSQLIQSEALYKQKQIEIENMITQFNTNHGRAPILLPIIAPLPLAVTAATVATVTDVAPLAVKAQTTPQPLLPQPLLPLTDKDSPKKVFLPPSPSNDYPLDSLSEAPNRHMINVPDQSKPIVVGSAQAKKYLGMDILDVSQTKMFKICV